MHFWTVTVPFPFSLLSFVINGLLLSHSAKVKTLILTFFWIVFKQDLRFILSGICSELQHQACMQGLVHCRWTSKSQNPERNCHNVLQDFIYFDLLIYCEICLIILLLSCFLSFFSFFFSRKMLQCSRWLQASDSEYFLLCISHLSVEHVPLVECYVLCIYVTCIAGKSDCRQFWSLLLRSEMSFER